MAGAATPVPGRLVLNWRSSDRRDATLEIDGRFVDLATALMSDSEALEFQLAPGAHEFCIARAASQPLRRRFTMEPGARFVVDVVFTPTPTGATLVLVWPQSAREGALLEIDGRAYDLNDAAVDAAGDRIRVSLPVGQHAVRVSRHGETLVERVVTLGMTTPTTLSIGPPLAKLLLRWRAENRKGVVLLLDDRPIDLPASRAADDATTLQLDVPAGRATLTVKRDESATRVPPDLAGAWSADRARRGRVARTCDPAPGPALARRPSSGRDIAGRRPAAAMARRRSGGPERVDAGHGTG